MSAATAAANSALVLACGEFQLGVGLDSAIALAPVERVDPPAPGDPSFVAGRIPHEGAMVPLVDAAALLGAETLAELPSRALLVRASDGRVAAIGVDGRFETNPMAVATTPLPGGLSELGDGFFKGAVEIDGNEILVLDADALLRLLGDSEGPA